MLSLLASLVAVSGCGQSQSGESDSPVLGAREEASSAAREVMDAIDGIGPVTLQSEEMITEIEALYDALTEEEKAEVSNYDVLVAARSALDQLKLQEFASDYLIQAKTSFLYPEDVSLNHVYVTEAADQNGAYYFTYDLTVKNIVGEEEQRLYGNTSPIALNDESLALLAQSVALSGLIGSNYWDCSVQLSVEGQELSSPAIQANYEASFL